MKALFDFLENGQKPPFLPFSEMDCPPKSVFPDTCAKMAKVAQVAKTMGEQGVGNLPESYRIYRGYRGYRICRS